MRCTVVVLAGLLTLAACGSDDQSGPSGAEPVSSPASTATATPPPSTAPDPTTSPAARTPQLDAIAIIGHSGATGYDSTGTGSDVPANSWATGTNPQVDSIYRRLLRSHPALEGHAYNAAVSGSDSNDLMSQAHEVVDRDPVPDIVFIQSIDNDLQCDGSDAQNLPAFRQRVADVVAFLEHSVPGVEIYFDDQAVDVHSYDVVLARRAEGLTHLDTGDDCDVVEDGALDPAGEAYLQDLVDEYFAQLVDICHSVPHCATDAGALQDVEVVDGDISPDLDHFAVPGLAKVAHVVWDSLPAGWKTSD